MGKIGFFLAVISVILSPASSFAGMWESTSDLRTAVPELLMQDHDWGLNLGGGFVYNAGNFNDIMATNDDTAFKKWGDYMGEVTAHYAYLAAGSPYARLQDLLGGTVRVDRVLADQWRLFAFSTQGYNDLQGISYRGAWGLGPWFQITTPSIMNGLSLAAVYETADYFPGLTFSGYTKQWARASIRDVFSVALSPTSHFTLDCFYAPALNDFTDYRVIFNPSLEVAINDSFSMKAYLMLEHVTYTPPGIQDLDIETGTSFTWHLEARK